MRFLQLFFLFILSSSFSLYSQDRTLQFSDPDINSRNEIILKVLNPAPTGVSYTTLVRGTADGRRSEALTVFPEQSHFSLRKNELILYNHFGCYSYDAANGIWALNKFLTSFSDQKPVSPLSLRPLEISPDGRFALFITEEGQMASLNLYDRERNISINITDRLNKEYVNVMAKWSPDSKYFIYRRGRELYYFSIDQYLSGRIPAETFRNTGFKDIQSIQWEEGNYLYILKNRIVYRIHSSEFFTRSFYSDPFRKGVVWGRIPILYDSAFDSYSIDNKGQKIFIRKNGQGGMVFPLQSSAGGGALRQTPILNGNANTEITRFLWLNDGTLLVLLKNSKTGLSELFAYRESRGPVFIQISAEGVTGLDPAPDGESFALFFPESVSLYDTETLSPSKSYPLRHILHFYWGQNQYIAVGKDLMTTIDKKSGVTALAGLSQIDEAGFSPSGSLLGHSDGQWYEYGEALNWIPAENGEIRPSRLGTPEYRIFLEPLRGQWYSGSLKIRRVDGFETRDFIPLYQMILPTGLPMPLTADGTSNPWYFDHGNRDENKEVSLVFNGIDSAEGVRNVLKILKDYSIKGTFFLNGDFIHNNPLETNLIASSENTVGSLFYTWFDMSDPGYQIDKTFLKKGLARNEDDYFIATGREMAMLWHAPFYYINSEILETSESMEYIYVGTDLSVQDRPGPGGMNPGISDDSVSAARSMLKKIRPGSIIPLSLGKVAGREEYLFQLLPMIIEDLLERGYSIVPLTQMIKSSR